MAVGGVERAVQRAGGFAQCIEHTAAMLQARAFGGAFVGGRVYEKRAKQLGGIVDRRHMHAGAGPAHVRAIDDTGVDRRETWGAANMLCRSLIE